MAPPFGGFGFRKSYRKNGRERGEVAAIPYRRCHEPLEGRIVGILNKMVARRSCQKDLEALADRIPRMTLRDTENRFIVAGIGSIIALAKDQSICEGRTLGRLREEQARLQARIADSLDSFEEFQSEGAEASGEESVGSARRREFLRRVYAVARRSFPGEGGAELRRRVVRECEECFTGEARLGLLVKFLRERAGR